MRRPALAALLLLCGCGAPTRYPGNILLGTFAFDGPRLADAGSCPFDLPDAGGPSPARLAFTGTFSLDSASNTVYLTVTGADRSAPLSGATFALGGGADRDVCGPTRVEETFLGTFWGPPRPTLEDGGCATLRGPGTFPDGGLDRLDGGPSPCFAPFGLGGRLADAFTGDRRPDGGVLCGSAPADAGSPLTCTTTYLITGVRQ